MNYTFLYEDAEVILVCCCKRVLLKSNGKIAQVPTTPAIAPLITRANDLKSIYFDFYSLPFHAIFDFLLISKRTCSFNSYITWLFHLTRFDLNIVVFHYSTYLFNLLIILNYLNFLIQQYNLRSFLFISLLFCLNRQFIWNKLRIISYLFLLIQDF